MDALDLGELIGYLIRRSQQAHVAAWQRYVSTDITSVQFGVLNVLRSRPGASQRELCDELDLDRSTIADIVSRLQRRGLLHRVRDGADKRRNVLDLTAQGRAEFDALVPGVRRVDAELTGSLAPAQQDDLRRLLVALLSDRPSADADGLPTA
jgi:DNA-binding MarR family transcriptional regulator